MSCFAVGVIQQVLYYRLTKTEARLRQRQKRGETGEIEENKYKPRKKNNI